VCCSQRGGPRFAPPVHPRAVSLVTRRVRQAAPEGSWSAPWLAAIAEATFECYCSRLADGGGGHAVRPAPPMMC